MLTTQMQREIKELDRWLTADFRKVPLGVLVALIMRYNTKELIRLGFFKNEYSLYSFRDRKKVRINIRMELVHALIKLRGGVDPIWMSQFLIGIASDGLAPDWSRLRSALQLMHSYVYKAPPHIPQATDWPYFGSAPNLEEWIRLCEKVATEKFNVTTKAKQPRVPRRRAQPPTNVEGSGGQGAGEARHPPAPLGGVPSLQPRPDEDSPRIYGGPSQPRTDADPLHAHSAR